MKSSWKKLFFVSVFLLILSVFILQTSRAVEVAVPSGLDDYLALPDDSYEWKVVESDTDSLNKTWLLELTSQTWHDITWKHYLIVVEPEELQYRQEAVLFITGGKIGSKPGVADRMVAQTLAQQTKSYVAMLSQVPNQPLLGPHVEDALISETLLKAIAEKDTTWPALFPMAKSAIRAMDAVQEFVKQERDQNVERFVVSGASKRGWTTWLTGASGDKRVVAIAPIVIDTLNISEQMTYQLETWGDWSESIADYTSRGLVDQNPENMDALKKSLWEMIDPYSYRSRLTMPKLLIHGTNDPYWTVDATQKYWNGLSEPKYIATFPNVGHNLGDQKIRAFQTLSVFAKYAFAGAQWPKVNWDHTEDASGDYLLATKAEFPVRTAKLWTACSDTKDFRQSTWSCTEIPISPDGTYRATINKPQSGHVAYYIELESNGDGSPFSLTTQVWRQ